MQPGTYAFDNKNKWRKDIWREVSLHLPTPERKKAVVLYLGGLEDLDRPEAIANGFSQENLILVERNHDICKYLRKAKKTVIFGDLKDVIDTWPCHTEIGLVLADFCEGVDFVFALNFTNILTRMPFWKTIFVFNFQRGREKNFAFWMKYLGLKKENHRGRLFIDIIFEGSTESDYFSSYRSKCGNLIFDSTIFENPRRVEVIDPRPIHPFDLYERNKIGLALRDLAKETSEMLKEGEQILAKHQYEATRRRSKNAIAAGLAVRTKRRSERKP